MECNRAVVSVVMITYNHENYIQQAIEGVLMQNCNFAVELIIADDHSPNKTEQIVREIISTSPKGNWIKYTRHEKNKGMVPNFIWALQQVNGKYIALCEGDDYWTDPLKLQKQVDFMEAHEDFALVCTQCNTTEETRAALVENKEIFPYAILHHNPISTLTVMLRKKLLDQINATAKNTSDRFQMLGDYPLWLAFAQHSRIMKLKDNTACYRILPNSASQRENKDKQLKYQEEILTITRHYLNNFKLTTAQKKAILEERLSYVLSYALNKGKITCLKYYLKYITLNRRIMKQVIAGLFH